MSSEEHSQPPAVPLSVGIVGATGLVGEIMRVDARRARFPGRLAAPLCLRALGRQAPRRGRTATSSSRMRRRPTMPASTSSSSRPAARRRARLAPVVAAAGAIVIDNSSAWRGRPDVPLVVAEVNPHALERIPKGIVANPNCTTMAAMPVLKPLHDAAGLRRLVASTYQAVSGAGLAGVRRARKPDAERAARRGGAGARRRARSIFRRRTSGRCRSPSMSCRSTTCIVEDGYTEEEVKLRDESRKILEIPDLAVSGTCVRVPVYTGHSLSINAEFERPSCRCRGARDFARGPGRRLYRRAQSAGGDGPRPGLCRPRAPRPDGRARPCPVRHRATICARAPRSTPCRSPSCCRRARPAAGSACWKRCRSPACRNGRDDAGARSGGAPLEWRDLPRGWDNDAPRQWRAPGRRR